MKKYFTLVLFAAFNFVLSAQGTSGSNAKFEYRNLIDLPTAGILEKGFVGVVMDFRPGGVVVPMIEVGVMNGFSFGIS